MGRVPSIQISTVSSWRAIDTQTDALKWGGNSRRTRTHTMSLGIGAWRGAIGPVTWIAIGSIAVCARLMGADDWWTPTNSTCTRCRQKHIRDINTNIYRFIPLTVSNCEFWVFRIRISRRRLDRSPGLPWMTLRHPFANLTSGGTDFSGVACGAWTKLHRLNESTFS